MILAALAGLGSALLFWSATRQQRTSEQIGWAAGGFFGIAIAMLLATSPDPMPGWVSRLFYTTTLLGVVGVGASVLVRMRGKQNEYRWAREHDLPAQFPRWPTPVVAGIWLVACLGALWLIGTGIQRYETTVIAPLLDALDPDQANTPEVETAIMLLVGAPLVIMMIALTATIILPALAAYLHHRKVRTETEQYIDDVDEYLTHHELHDDAPTGAVDAPR